MFPSKPAFTEANLGDLKGKVYVITGANTGVGKELACLLYSKNASVFIAARSEEKSQAAIKDVHESHPRSTGTVEFLAIDLADLESVAQAAKVFQSKAERLDVLFNNAGVMHPPKGSKTKQGYELQLGVHNLGPVLLTELLTPLMARTAAQEAARGAKDGVRVVWVGSLYAELNTPKGGYEPDNIDYSKRDKSTTYKYSASKAGVFYQGTEYARRNKEKGIVSFVSQGDVSGRRLTADAYAAYQPRESQDRPPTPSWRTPGLHFISGFLAPCCQWCLHGTFCRAVARWHHGEIRNI